MNEEETEKYRRLAGLLGVKGFTDSHPTPEEIYRFCSGVAEHELAMRIENHLTFCGDCQELEGDTQLYVECESEVARGEGTPLPASLSLALEKVRNLTVLERPSAYGRYLRELPERIALLFDSLAADFNLQHAAVPEQFESFLLPWREDQVEIGLFRTEYGLEVYTPEAKLIGRALVIRGKGEMRWKFVEDDSTDGMKASAFIPCKSFAERDPELWVGLEK